MPYHSHKGLTNTNGLMANKTGIACQLHWTKACAVPKANTTNSRLEKDGKQEGTGTQNTVSDHTSK